MGVSLKGQMPGLLYRAKMVGALVEGLNNRFSDETKDKMLLTSSEVANLCIWPSAEEKDKIRGEQPCALI